MSNHARYKLSRYTVSTELGDGRIALYNTFMGALAVAPAASRGVLETARVRACTKKAFEEAGIGDFCDQGLLVPSDFDEREAVEKLLKRERNGNDLFLILLPFQGCNFKCLYCYEDLKKMKMTSGVQRGLKRLIRKKAGELKYLDVGWFGGEPLLGLDVIRNLSRSFIDSCARTGCRYKSNMTTNGYDLDLKTFEELHALNVRKYQITLDGPQQQHDHFRPLVNGGGTYERILHNILKIKQSALDFRVMIRMNFNSDNRVHLAKLLDELTGHFAGDDRFEVSFQPIGKWGGEHDDELNTYDSDVDSIRNTRLGLEEYALSGGLANSVMRRRLQYHGAICYAARETSLIVGADGSLFKCTVAFNDERNRVGELKEDGRLVLDAARFEDWTQAERLDCTKCDDCAVYPICQSRACPLNSLDTGEPQCPTVKEEAEELLRLFVHDREKSLSG
ncbi:MAG: radical SAM protein, partial [Proteobacteria bacterium]|nr:radical SAM protein [Pseudomonadota bacterium]